MQVNRVQLTSRQYRSVQGWCGWVAGDGAGCARPQVIAQTVIPRARVRLGLAHISCVLSLGSVLAELARFSYPCIYVLYLQSLVFTPGCMYSGVVGLHSVRVDDGLWSAALARARGEGRTVTDVVVSALSEYAGDRVVSPSVAEPAPSQSDRVLVSRAAGGGITSRDVAPVFEDEIAGCEHPAVAHDYDLGVCGICRQDV